MSKNLRFPRKKYMGEWRWETSMMIMRKRFFPGRVIRYNKKRQSTNMKNWGLGVGKALSERIQSQQSNFPPPCGCVICRILKRTWLRKIRVVGMDISNNFYFHYLDLFLEQPLKSTKAELLILLMIKEALRSGSILLNITQKPRLEIQLIQLWNARPLIL